MTDLTSALDDLVNTTLPSSEWKLIDQKRIDLFATATEDMQWIHVDVTRAKREMPNGMTIAHGFLSLSLAAGIKPAGFELPGVAKSLNYGFNKIRFLDVISSGSRVRIHAQLKEWKPRHNNFLLIWEITVEQENSDTPAVVAEALQLLEPEE
ncbi:MAG: hypothetical protein COB36_14525 [Alphaproteobacteria bacterium]|nr:MAG: hypothetical protein COB36_14525 [Alphaproteobacteria bacterium]